MKRYATGQIRNVALVGHSGAGKTSLAEALLHRAGAIPRMGRVEDGTTACDFDPEEHRRGISLSLSVAPLEWRDHKINLVDTPGYADFMGEVAAALRIADLAVFVVSALDGVEVQTEEAWEMARALGVPRMVFVNKLDHERASFDPALAQLRDRLGSGIAPLELPIGAGAGFRGIADLLTDTAHIYERGSRTPRRSPTTWRRSSTRCTTTWSRASSWPTTPCSSATSTATCPASTSSAHPPRRHRRRHRLPGSSARPPARSASTDSPTCWSRLPVAARPPGADRGRQRRRACAHRRHRGRHRRPARLRVQDDRRSLCRAGQPLPGRVGHGAARRPPDQQPHGGRRAAPRPAHDAGQGAAARPSSWPATSGRCRSWPAR